MKMRATFAYWRIRLWRTNGVGAGALVVESQDVCPGVTRHKIQLPRIPSSKHGSENRPGEDGGGGIQGESIATYEAVMS